MAQPWFPAALGALAVAVAQVAPPSEAATPSPDTEVCLACHLEVTPGIVADWRGSRHARVSPREALAVPGPARRFSAATALPGGEEYAVGCAECHTLRPEAHGDTFEHNGFRVHVVVSPDDCAGCHPVERAEYANNLMANAYDNLQGNPVYRQLAHAINAVPAPVGGASLPPSELDEADSCLACHGTRVEVARLAPRATAMGEMDFPVLVGWPNQGVGRINPDGSRGACTPCHPRHGFSIAMARKPETCAQCHKGPDVPAYPVYQVSKHGNLYGALGGGWDFDAVPWMVGRDFTAPTCATCHVSQVVAEGGRVVAARTHRMNDRSEWRLFGPLYAHPHPVSADTTIIRNRAGLPLPTELTGEPAEGFLIGPDERRARRERMQGVCLACHSRQWTEGHFARLDRAVETTNQLTLAATQVLMAAWQEGLARGIAQGENPFDEALERKWVNQWLFYANSTRFASAMGGADYGVFANGRYYLTANLQELLDYVGFLRAGRPPPQ